MTATIDKPRLQTRYKDEIQASVLKEFNLGNVSMTPKIAIS